MAAFLLLREVVGAMHLDPSLAFPSPNPAIAAPALPAEGQTAVRQNSLPGISEEGMCALDLCRAAAACFCTEHHLAWLRQIGPEH